MRPDLTYDLFPLYLIGGRPVTLVLLTASVGSDIIALNAHPYLFLGLRGGVARPDAGRRRWPGMGGMGV
jgi:hypothetical protein